MEDHARDRERGANDMLCAITIRSIKPGSFEALRDLPALLGADDERLSRIAGYEEALVHKGIFEVVEEVTAPA
jgi:hypothetical protein